MPLTIAEMEKAEANIRALLGLDERWCFARMEVGRTILRVRFVHEDGPKRGVLKVSWPTKEALRG